MNQAGRHDFFYIFLMKKKKQTNRPSDEEVTITRMLDKVLKRSDAVDKESLCILAGQRVCAFIKPNDFCHIPRFLLFQVWHIRLTLHFLADAGNLLDCACLAGIVALKHFRRPDVEVIGDEVTVVCFFGSYMERNYESEHRISLASPFWTSPSTPSYPSYTVLLHFCILPWCINASDYRSFSTRTATQRRVGINSSKCPKGIMCSSKTRRSTA